MFWQMAKNRAQHALEIAGFRPRQYFGLNGLDHAIAKYVVGVRGFFVEAGANDGISQSNTAYFERYRGWRGLLIEPVPHLAERCRINRPKATVVERALVKESSPGMEVSMTYCNLMSLVEGARGSAAADLAHIERGKQFLSSGEEVRHLKVPCATLTEILIQNKVKNVDLLSLDVEGYEGDALRGLDFDYCAPKWIVVEANNPDSVDSILKDRYNLHATLSHHDRLYRLRQRG